MTVKNRLDKLEAVLKPDEEEQIHYVILYKGDPAWGKADPKYTISYHS